MPRGSVHSHGSPAGPKPYGQVNRTTLHSRSVRLSATRSKKPRGGSDRSLASAGLPPEHAQSELVAAKAKKIAAKSLSDITFGYVLPIVRLKSGLENCKFWAACRRGGEMGKRRRTSRAAPLPIGARRLERAASRNRCGAHEGLSFHARGLSRNGFLSLSLLPSILRILRAANSSGRSTTSFSSSSLATSSSAGRWAARISRTFFCASIRRFLISSSTMRAVSSLYTLFPAAPGIGKNGVVRGASKATMPNFSLMPNWVTMVRAISVALCRSFCAPVDTSPKTISSATLPPSRV